MKHHTTPHDTRNPANSSELSDDALDGVVGGAARMECTNNLKQLGLASTSESAASVTYGPVITVKPKG